MREELPNVTEKMLRWLVHLRDHGPCKRWTRSSIGWRCARAGLTEWDFRDPQTGEPISGDQALRLMATGGGFCDHEWKERLTDAGRARIAALEEEGKS